MRYFLAIFCFTVTVATLEAAKMMGPVGNIIANSIFECKEKPPGDDVLLRAELKNIDDKGTKAMFANLTNKVPIDDTIDYTLDVQKWESGGWKKIYNVKGKFCTDVEKLFSKIWKKVRDAAEPSVPAPCPIKPGTYVINKFQANSKDLTLPAIFYGRFLLKLTVSRNKKTIVCVQGEGVSQSPI